MTRQKITYSLYCGYCKAHTSHSRLFGTGGKGFMCGNCASIKTVDDHTLGRIDDFIEEKN